MDSSLLEQIDTSAYFRMLEVAVPGTRAVGIFADGKIRAATDHDNVRSLLEFTRRKVCSSSLEWPPANPVAVYDASDTDQCLVACLCNANGDLAGHLVLLCSGKAQPDHVESASAVVRCLINELMLSAELNSMTTELTERYEELNLVYHTEDQVNYFREGTDALTQLVDNCNSYLDVGLTALVLKSKKVEIVRSTLSQTLDDAQIILTRLQNELYDWVQTNNATLVVNDVTDEHAATLLRGVPYKVLCTPVLDGGGEVAGVLAILNDHSRLNFTNSDRNLLSVMARKAGKIIQANYDALTGLVNRGGFEFFLEAAATEVRGTSRQHCVLHLNIDQLRVVNDTASHHAGDEVIRQVVKTVGGHLRETDTMARIGGDQFGILLENCTLKHGQKIAEEVRASVKDLKISFNGREHAVSLSQGLAVITAKTPDIVSTLAGAELACSASSDKGGNRVEIYHDENSELVQRRRQMDLVEKIQKAIGDDGFVLYSQVIRPIQNPNEPDHFEILLRMTADDEIVSPALFIPAAERYHLMPAVDRWVTERALTALSEVSAAVLDSCLFAINLSGQSLGDPAFLEFLIDLVNRSPVPKHSICFEITETAAIDNLSAAQHFITTVGALGCQFSLDDFGAGLSSFAYLKSLPVDQLKIDGVFVKDLIEDDVSAAMVASIHQIGHTMGLKTIAEFVENDTILARLKEMGVDYAQGFGVGKPMPLEEQLRQLSDVPAAAEL